MYELKKLEKYLRVNLLGPGPRLIKKEFTRLQSHKGWETLIYTVPDHFMPTVHGVPNKSNYKVYAYIVKHIYLVVLVIRHTTGMTNLKKMVFPGGHPYKY